MKRLLVVDNDQNTTETIRVAFSTEKDYEIETAFNGREALDKMKENNYDLIVLDLMMPEVSGIEVCKVMVKDGRLAKMSVLIVSALPVNSRVFQESQARFDELGVVKDVLEKPFVVDELLAKARAIVEA